MKRFPFSIKLPFSRKKSRRTAIAIILMFTFLLAAPCIRYGIFLKVPPGSGKTSKIVDFKEGSPLKKIAEDLAKSRVISSEELFILYARIEGAEGRIKAGTYLLNDGMTPHVILHKLLTGDVYVRRFAVPEGYSIYQLAVMLERRGFFSRDAFLDQCTNQSLLAELGINAPSVEGYLYPSTYEIKPNATAADLIREMVAQFRKHYSREFAARAKAMRMSPREVLTLASMVEKEAMTSREKPLIASVFLNRLKKNMPLQSDPTAVYKVRAFAGKVSKEDIMRDSPYNTYKVNGLPPGPIGNPGSDAIKAVLNPVSTNYLYFVAKMDGTHYFSRTLEEHNRAVQKYLKSRPSSDDSESASSLHHRDFKGARFDAPPSAAEYFRHPEHFGIRRSDSADYFGQGDGYDRSA